MEKETEEGQWLITGSKRFGLNPHWLQYVVQQSKYMQIYNNK